MSKFFFGDLSTVLPAEIMDQIKTKIDLTNTIEVQPVLKFPFGSKTVSFQVMVTKDSAIGELSTFSLKGEKTKEIEGQTVTNSSKILGILSLDIVKNFDGDVKSGVILETRETPRMKFMFTNIKRYLTTSVEIRDGSKVIMVVPTESH